MTNPPPVAPVEGHYALLRNGMVVKHLVDMWDAHRGPKTKRDYWTAHPDTDFSDLCWHEDGKSRDDSDYDIIATISPADMQAVASGELERLRAALQNIRALAAKRQHEGGPDGNFKAIEEFAVYGLEGKNP